MFHFQEIVKSSLWFGNLSVLGFPLSKGEENLIDTQFAYLS